MDPLSRPATMLPSVHWGSGAEIWQVMCAYFLILRVTYITFLFSPTSIARNVDSISLPCQVFRVYEDGKFTTSTGGCFQVRQATPSPPIIVIPPPPVIPVLAAPPAPVIVRPPEKPLAADAALVPLVIWAPTKDEEAEAKEQGIKLSVIQVKFATLACALV